MPRHFAQGNFIAVSDTAAVSDDGKVFEPENVLMRSPYQYSMLSLSVHNIDADVPTRACLK